MSQVKVQGNASGTGIFTIASPNSNNNQTLTLPDTTGEVVTTSSAAFNIGSGQLVKDASGNVGIGTSSPGVRLVVSGTTSSDIYRLASNQSAPTSTDAFIYRPTDNTLGFGTASTERARIDSSGNFLFNKTTTAASGSGVCFQTNDTTQFYRGGDGQALQFFRSSTQVGSISVTGTNTAFNTSSDYRLKHDVQPMAGALARVTALKPCTYKWNLDNSDGEGFIAHELAEVVPGCVTGAKDAVDEEGKPVYQGIDTSFLVATLTAAIQEQQALITSLTARMDAQAAEIAALKGAA